MKRAALLLIALGCTFQGFGQGVISFVSLSGQGAFTVVLDGAHAVPPNDTSFAGIATLQLRGNQMSYYVQTTGPQGIRPVSMRIEGSATSFELPLSLIGISDPIYDRIVFWPWQVVPLEPFYVNSFSGSITLTDQQLRAVLSNESLLTVDFGVYGSIAGQLITPPEVEIATTKADAFELGAEPAQFTITRTGPTNSALQVYYLIGGSATNAVDYVALTNSIVIPAGANSVSIPVIPIDDNEPDGRETVVLTVYYPAFSVSYSPIVGGWMLFQINPLAWWSNPQPGPSYMIRTNASARVYIHDNDGGPDNHAPAVTIVSPADGQTLTATEILLRTYAQDADGSVRSVEFFANGRSVGKNSNSFDPLPQDPTFPIFSLFSTHDYTWRPRAGEYEIVAVATDNDGAKTASTPIRVNVTKGTLVTLRAADSQAAEPTDSSTTNTASFVITRSGIMTNDLEVWYTLEGSATYGLDYILATSVNSGLLEQVNSSVVIPAGNASVTVQVIPLADDLREPEENVRVTLIQPITFYVVPFSLVSETYNPPYRVAPRSEVTLDIQDSGPRNRAPEIRITRPTSQGFLAAGSDILIEAEAIDRETYVEKVEFFSGVNKLGEIAHASPLPTPGTSQPFQFVWTNAPAGLHLLRARAVDSQEASRAASVRISVR